MEEKNLSCAEKRLTDTQSEVVSHYKGQGRYWPTVLTAPELQWALSPIKLGDSVDVF